MSLFVYTWYLVSTFSPKYNYIYDVVHKKVLTSWSSAFSNVYWYAFGARVPDFLRRPRARRPQHCVRCCCGPHALHPRQQSGRRQLGLPQSRQGRKKADSRIKTSCRHHNASAGMQRRLRQRGRHRPTRGHLHRVRRYLRRRIPPFRRLRVRCWRLGHVRIHVSSLLRRCGRSSSPGAFVGVDEVGPGRGTRSDARHYV